MTIQWYSSCSHIKVRAVVGHPENFSEFFPGSALTLLLEPDSAQAKLLILTPGAVAGKVIPIQSYQ
jgi:hypothetical protein